MSRLPLAARALLRGLLVPLLAVGLSGCASFYVDGATPEAPPSSFTRPEPVRPVQALFEFQTKGVANEQATKLLRDRVIAQLSSSGLFSQVSDKPVEGAALLSVKLNNVPLTDDAFTKGFVTGLTFGLAGSKVSDGYILTLQYRRGEGAPIVKQARHAIHATIGATSAPGNATKAENAEAAATAMTRQVLSQGLLALSQDPAFR